VTVSAELPRRARAFAPASVSNVGCGFDALGFAIDAQLDRGAPYPLGDCVEVVPRTGPAIEPGVSVVEIVGDRGCLPHDAQRNTAAGAAAAVLERSGALVRLEITVHKHMPLRSGLGSSAASAVAAVVATNAALGAELDDAALLECALAGERIASGSLHADNVAPSLLGGMVLVRALTPTPDIVRLPVPKGLLCVVVRPELEVDTQDSRRSLGDQVALTAAVTQWANVGALVAGLFRGDLELIRRSVHDAVAEPLRTPAIPGFEQARSAALQAGAIAAGLSGSGPTLFAFSNDARRAAHIGAAAKQVWGGLGIAAEAAISPVGAQGARVVECD
jgi:homoserine kinase